MVYMADTTDLLNKIRHVVREEVEAETKISREENVRTRLELSNKINKLEDRLKNIEISGSRVEKGQQKQGKDIDLLLSGQSHIETAIKSLATKQDIERVEKEVDKIKRRVGPHRAD